MAGRDFEHCGRLYAATPDSALIQIKNINKESLRGRYNKARYALLYSQALDKNYIDVESDSLISDALQYYSHRGPKIEELLQNADDKHLLGLTANAMARLYQRQNFLEVAKDKYLEAAQNFLQIENRGNALYSYMAALSVCAILMDYDEFDLYNQKAYELAIRLQDSTQLLSLAKINASNVIDKTDDYRECIDILSLATEDYNHGVVPRDYYPLLGKIICKSVDNKNFSFI